ncbi:hypothetical protein [Mucilaginibacter sp. UR6-11]|uniref:WapI family immunity protein n=1 Tax=Mucilaginibacter sp. UR6-11 TaxID=1435644 RepID=UPI001E57E07E|nr:hypothetical protein [Mucilaginibacter sp. UR6-11]MCC8424032.1 hypothetical protein [Mucilaginibacter sp. UR6-11]
MNDFTLNGDSGDFLKIAFNKVEGYPDTPGYFGGYDIESAVEIKSASFTVKSTMYSSTGEVCDFYSQLLKANDLLAGSVYLRNYEDNLDVEIKYDVNGHASVLGNFSKWGQLLKFAFSTDQTYIQSTLQQLKFIVDKYGGAKGVKSPR